MQITITVAHIPKTKKGHHHCAFLGGSRRRKNLMVLPLLGAQYRVSKGRHELPTEDMSRG